MSGFLKMKHTRQWNSSQGNNVIRYPLYKKNTLQQQNKPTTTKNPNPKQHQKEKKKNQKETKFTGFENDLILAALARFSVGQWKASHGTIK